MADSLRRVGEPVALYLLVALFVVGLVVLGVAGAIFLLNWIGHLSPGVATP